MEIYQKPEINSYIEEYLLENFCSIQTQYPVQFSIQAIEFQIGANTKKSAEIVRVVKINDKELVEIRNIG